MSIADYAQRLWDEAETKENPQPHRAPLAPVADGADSLHVLEDIVEISIDKLFHFPTSRYNRYTLHTGEKMQELVDNIRCNGILMPLVVREIPQGYEIISGKNRREAARLLGYKVVPCIVRTLDDTEALCQLNFLNSEFRELRPSERAFAYQLEYEQKYHPQQDDTAPTDDTSRMTKYRYRQLCHFTLDGYLDAVDNGLISVNPAVAIASLTDKQQRVIWDTFFDPNATPVAYRDTARTLNQSVVEQLVALARDCPTFTQADVEDLFIQAEAVAPEPPKPLDIPLDLKPLRKRYSQLEGLPSSQINEILLKALELYFTAQT